jgi:dTDP-4-amino-4,6-dideoxygalactose transaminase
MAMGDTRKQQTAALHGSLKAVTTIRGKGEPKIGVEEFMSVAERFGLSTNALQKIRKVVEKEDWGEGPFLGNYYSNLKETKGQAFARVTRKFFGVKYALPVSSGTAALHSALVAAGVGPGTEVICSAIGFFSTAAAVVMAKGVPVFCDVDDSLAMNPELLESKITERTVVIAPTHVMGTVCNMEAILAIARKHNLKVVEDCAQSCGGKYKGRMVGTWGDLGCFSISAYKIIGGGEGGLVITSDERLWERANQLAESGGLWRLDRFAPPRYANELFCGTNYRMSELEAAIDVVQMTRMPGVFRRSNAVKKRILKQLKTFREIRPQRLNDVEGDVGYLLRFYPESIDLGLTLVADLQARGISCGTRGKTPSPDWHIYSEMMPVLLQTGPDGKECVYTCPHYTEKGGQISYAKGDCPVADDLYNRVVSINLNQWYTVEDCRGIAKTLNEVFKKHCTYDREATPWL